MPTPTKQKRLSDNFLYSEAIFTRKPFDNTPTPEQLENIKKTAAQMERVRALAGNKIVTVSSWFRSAAVNKAVGGSKTSQHLTGEAVDFNIFSYGTPRDICELIVANKDLIRFDQLILEPSWVHISFLSDRRRTPRFDVRTKTPDGKYPHGLIKY